MKMKTMLILATVALGCAIGVAWATPTFNLAAPLLASGTTLSSIFSYGDSPSDDFEAAVFTSGPSSIIFQDVAYAPGGHTGWHSHPGVLGVSLVSGSLDWYDADCNPVSYKAGDSWTEGSQLHYSKVTSNVSAHFLVAYFIKKGAATRIDEAAPSCAAALGLN